MQVYCKVGNIEKPLERPQRTYTSNLYNPLPNPAPLFPFEEKRNETSALVKAVFGHPAKSQDIDAILAANGFVPHSQWIELVDQIDNAQRARFYPGTKVYRQSDHAKSANGTLYPYEVGIVVGYAVRTTQVGPDNLIFPILVRWGDPEGVAKYQQPSAYAMKELCLHDNEQAKDIGPADGVLLGNTGETP